MPTGAVPTWNKKSPSCNAEKTAVGSPTGLGICCNNTKFQSDAQENPFQGELWE